MKLAIAAIVAVPVLTAPAESAAQADPWPKPVEEHWSCDGEIALFSYCLSDDTCSGTVKTGNYPSKVTDFNMTGIERRWDWCLKHGVHECAFIIKPGGPVNGAYYDFSRSKGAKPTSLHECGRK